MAAALLVELTWRPVNNPAVCRNVAAEEVQHPSDDRSVDYPDVNHGDFPRA